MYKGEVGVVLMLASIRSAMIQMPLGKRTGNAPRRPTSSQEGSAWSALSKAAVRAKREHARGRLYRLV